MEEYYSKLRGQILDTKKDEVLQGIVKKATEVSNFPIALVSIILRRTQFFRAFTGISQQLGDIQATDRCVSFCQYVVKQKKPLKIADAKAEASLPQQLVNLYGIRAYYGTPLKLHGEVVGSLCVIDTKPHQISENAETALAALAEKVSHRLEELGQSSAPLQVAPQTRETWWEALTSAQLDADIARTELAAFIKASDIYGQDKNQGEKFMEAFKDAGKSFEDLQKAMLKMNELIQSLKATRPTAKT